MVLYRCMAQANPCGGYKITNGAPEQRETRWVIARTNTFCLSLTVYLTIINAYHRSSSRLSSITDSALSPAKHYFQEGSLLHKLSLVKDRMLASLQLWQVIFSHVCITYTRAVDARLNLKQVRSRDCLLPILNF